MNQIKLTNHPIFNKLLSLGLNPDDYVVFGSAPMWLHGLKELNHDIDLLARGEAWAKATTLGEIKVPASGECHVIELLGGSVEIFDGWWPGDWNIDQLIDSAQIVDGVRFATLEDVLKWKKLMIKKWDREKDHLHIQMIEKYLESQAV